MSACETHFVKLGSREQASCCIKASLFGLFDGTWNHGGVPPDLWHWEFQPVFSGYGVKGSSEIHGHYDIHGPVPSNSESKLQWKLHV